MASAPHILSSCTGKIGFSILPRLEKLGTELPDPFLREVAKTTVARIKDMEDLPVVLNHGDFIPSNVLVDEETWEISGLVDWAEAEDLPFGMCMYGVEYVLGYWSTVCQTRDESLNAPVFAYHENAAYLRELFWRRLCELEPDVKSRLEDVKTMRDAGVLLWFGYAWDDGAIDRVVNEKDDGVEVACLQAFLDVT
jgi:Ser/Thr protein kinase RdoA (MazF antagonist)